MSLDKNEESPLLQVHQGEKEQLFLECAGKTTGRSRRKVRRQKTTLFLLNLLYFLLLLLQFTSLPLLMLTHFFHMFNKSREFVIHFTILKTSTAQSAGKWVDLIGRT